MKKEGQRRKREREGESSRGGEIKGKIESKKMAKKNTKKPFLQSALHTDILVHLQFQYGTCFSLQPCISPGSNDLLRQHKVS